MECKVYRQDGCFLSENMPKLKHLNFAGTRVSDTGLASLAKLRALGNLGLARTQITDKGLAVLRELPALEYLHLDETQITDAGLDSLANCGKLSNLYVRRTEVRRQGLLKLHKALPNCKFDAGEAVLKEYNELLTRKPAESGTAMAAQQVLIAGDNSGNVVVEDIASGKTLVSKNFSSTAIGNITLMDLGRSPTLLVTHFDTAGKPTYALNPSTLAENWHTRSVSGSDESTSFAAFAPWARIGSGDFHANGKTELVIPLANSSGPYTLKLFSAVNGTLLGSIPPPGGQDTWYPTVYRDPRLDVPARQRPGSKRFHPLLAKHRP